MGLGDHREGSTDKGPWIGLFPIAGKAVLELESTRRFPSQAAVIPEAGGAITLLGGGQVTRDAERLPGQARTAKKDRDDWQL